MAIKNNFKPDRDIPDLGNRVILVTGGNFRFQNRDGLN